MPVNSGVLRFAKISQNAIIPTKGSTLAAGYDLYRFIAICFCVLMFPSVAGVKSTVICGMIGECTKLFNIDNDYAEPSLYNGTEILVASWEGTTDTAAYMDHHYIQKIFMDNRNISICDVQRKDAGKYYLKFGIQNERPEITLNVMEKHQECPNDHPDMPKEAQDNHGSYWGLYLFFLIIPFGLIYICYRKNILPCTTRCQDTNTSIPSSSVNAGTPKLQDTDTSNLSSSVNAGAPNQAVEEGETNIPMLPKLSEKDKRDQPRNDETFCNDDEELQLQEARWHTDPL